MLLANLKSGNKDTALKKLDVKYGITEKANQSQQPNQYNQPFSIV